VEPPLAWLLVSSQNSVTASTHVEAHLTLVNVTSNMVFMTFSDKHKYVPVQSKFHALVICQRTFNDFGTLIDQSHACCFQQCLRSSMILGFTAAQEFASHLFVGALSMSMLLNLNTCRTCLRCRAFALRVRGSRWVACIKSSYRSRKL
jgi:hypothetical protein